jgi:16S rRNA (uracil1498-N3)-methyltransferase
MADRYFVEMPIAGPQACLHGGEAHHLAHVMRARPGDMVTLFDGSGVEFSARIESVGRAEIELAILTRDEIDRELPWNIVLGVALPKGDRGRWLVEKVTELGVARLVPLVSGRAGEHQSAAGLAKLRRAVIEASKQCGRNRLMDVDIPRRFDEWLEAVSPRHVRLIAQPGATPIAWVLGAVSLAQSGQRAVSGPNTAGQASSGTQTGIGEQASSGTPTGITIAIGPEGGFTSAEIATAKAAGWQAVGLGARTLRIETAALALVAAIVVQAEFPATDAARRGQ